MTQSLEPVRTALRKLWTDHVIWTREYIVASVRGPKGLTNVAGKLPVGDAGPVVASVAGAALGAVPLSDADAAAARLLRNQEDIGEAFVPYYGREAGTNVT